MSKNYRSLIGNILAGIASYAPAARRYESLQRAGAGSWCRLRPDKKGKEFIALAIGITQRCNGSIGLDAKAWAGPSASRDETAKVTAMSVNQGGGPALLYAADAPCAFDQFAAHAG